jgi:EAL domain-containing protein (putative c-di-GMP-specific phosphodiesterase class I)
MLILRESLRQVHRWRDDGLDLNVAVNISPRHLTDIDLPGQIAALMRDEGLPGSALTLEVTESSIMSDPSRAGLVLRRLRDLGIAISIDDFGTGYSSLAYLRDLSATEVKIDRTFVQRAADSERDRAIVRAAVDLGHSLGLQVVAEGIEDIRTAALMASIGCDLVQGFLILPPVPADEVADWCQQPQVWTRSLPGPAAQRQAAAER